MDRVTTLAARLRRLTLKIAHAHDEATLLAVTTVALAAGGVAWTVGAGSLADLFWALGTVAAVVPAVWWVFAALRQGDVRVDLVAVLALGGTLAVQEYLAGALIALMLATGRALESAAQRRASRDLRARWSVPRAPRACVRPPVFRWCRRPRSASAACSSWPPGKLVPVDGTVESTSVVLDESALTGEPLQTERSRGETVRSGVLNAGTAFELRATATVSCMTSSIGMPGSPARTGPRRRSVPAAAERPKSCAHRCRGPGTTARCPRCCAAAPPRMPAIPRPPARWRRADRG